MINYWQYSTIHNCACKVIDEQTLWGQTVCRVWLPDQDAVVRKIPENVLQEDPKLLVWYDQALTRSGEE